MKRSISISLIAFFLVWSFAFIAVKLPFMGPISEAIKEFEMTDTYYQILQDTMLEKLNQDKLSAWSREKQKTTYIRINGDWRQCEFEYPGWIKE